MVRVAIFGDEKREVAMEFTLVQAVLAIMGANLALIVVLVDHLKFQLILSQIAIVAFLTLINYTVLRLWTFHEQHAHDGVVH